MPHTNDQKLQAPIRCVKWSWAVSEFDKRETKLHQLHTRVSLDKFGALQNDCLPSWCVFREQHGGNNTFWKQFRQALMQQSKSLRCAPWRIVFVVVIQLIFRTHGVPGQLYEAQGWQRQVVRLQNIRPKNVGEKMCVWRFDTWPFSVLPFFSTLSRNGSFWDRILIYTYRV